MIVLYVLQNAYQSPKYNFRNQDEWHRDLNRSYTGKRLREMIPDGHDIRVINASPRIGSAADSCFDADLVYLRQKLKEINPDVICACGRVAQEGLTRLGVAFVAAPHPAWRAFSKIVAKRVRSHIVRRINERSKDAKRCSLVECLAGNGA